MDLALSDKTVFITGASGGIGRAMARTFAAEGASLALHGHRRWKNLNDWLGDQPWRGPQAEYPSWAQSRRYTYRQTRIRPKPEHERRCHCRLLLSDSCAGQQHGDGDETSSTAGHLQALCGVHLVWGVNGQYYRRFKSL